MADDKLYVKTKKKYDKLFTDEDKVNAFDSLAEHFYYGNFSTMSKSEIELLMFSIYLDTILNREEKTINEYSDYELSKVFGITQRRISNLKEKKQLKYPREIDWKKEFLKHLKNVRYENKYFIVNIRDINLYREVENSIENNGGYIDVQLNSKILKVREEYFIDLILNLAENEGQMRKKVRKILKNSGGIDISEFEEEKSFGDIMKSSVIDNIPGLISKVLSGIIPVAGPMLQPIIEEIVGGVLKKYSNN